MLRRKESHIRREGLQRIGLAQPGSLGSQSAAQAYRSSFTEIRAWDSAACGEHTSPHALLPNVSIGNTAISLQSLRLRAYGLQLVRRSQLSKLFRGQATRLAGQDQGARSARSNIFPSGLHPSFGVILLSIRKPQGDVRSSISGGLEMSKSQNRKRAWHSKCSPGGLTYLESKNRPSSSYSLRCPRKRSKLGWYALDTVQDHQGGSTLLGRQQGTQCRVSKRFPSRTQRAYREKQDPT